MTMFAKSLITNLISGALGGFLCFGLFYYSSNRHAAVNEETNVSRLVNQPEINFGSTVGPDFVAAAQKSTHAVVHILAEESEQQALARMKNRRPSMFEDFFGADMFGGDFFGGNYYRQKNGSGSGVVYTADGYIVTNNHVVGFADKIEVTLSDGKKYRAKKIGTDPSTDLAVIKIEASGLKPMDIANSDELKVGEWVLAVGNPFDYLTSTVTAGIISAKGRDLGLIEAEKSIEEFIQTDAAINPGNSGGALVTSDGKLAGITTAIATPTGVYAGYSFAIPSNLMQKIITSIIEKGGDIERLNLGIGGYDVDEDLIKELNLKTKKGFYVEELDTKSPAKMAGVLPGDVIIKIDKSNIATFEDITTAMKFSKKGDMLKIVVNRDGKEVSIPTNLR